MVTVASLLQNSGLSRLIIFVSRFTFHPCKKFVNRLYLVLHVYFEIFDMIFFIYGFYGAGIKQGQKHAGGGEGVVKRRKAATFRRSGARRAPRRGEAAAARITAP